MTIVSPYASPYPTVLVPPHGPFLTLPQENQLGAPAETNLPRFVNYAADLSGCYYWRIGWPELLINSSGMGVSCSLTAMVGDPGWYTNTKCVKIQRQASTDQKRFVMHLKEIQKVHNFKIIYEVDDVVFSEEIPLYNKFRDAFATPEIRQNCIDIINMCDEVTVTCDFMRKLYQQKTGKKEVTVIPNFIPHFWMGHQFNKRRVYDNFDKFKKRPRIAYTGSGAHYDVDFKNNGIDDFSHVLDFVIKTRFKYQWVFVGSFPPPLLEYIQNKEIEYHPWQTLVSYPAMLASLNAQAFIAPLQVNRFNNSKSDIKFIEACILGLPCLVQDMETYKNAPEFLKFKTGTDLETKLDDILKNKAQYYRNVDMYRHIGEQRLLELPENIGCHMEVLTTPYGSPERKYLKRWNP